MLDENTLNSLLQEFKNKLGQAGSTASDQLEAAKEKVDVAKSFFASNPELEKEENSKGFLEEIVGQVKNLIGVDLKLNSFLDLKNFDVTKLASLVDLKDVGEKAVDALKKLF